MQVKIFSIHHLHITSYPLWIAAIKQKRVQKSEVYSYIPLSSHSETYTQYSFFYTESPSNGDSMAETLNCVSLLKKTNPNILNIADIWIRCKDFLPIKEGGLKPPSACLYHRKNYHRSIFAALPKGFL